MEYVLERLSCEWGKLAAKAKREEYVSFEELFAVYKETHKVIKAMSCLETLPREAYRIIMLLDEFTYYAAIGDENYLGDICTGLYYLNYALKSEFFKGDYRSEFFMGALEEDFVPDLLDNENISLDNFKSFLLNPPRKN